MNRALALLVIVSGPATAQVKFPFERTDHAVAHPPVGVVAADLDLDGFPDLVAPSETADRVVVLLNQGDGSFGAPFEVASPSAPIAARVGRLDADAVPDLAVLSDEIDRVFLYRGLGDGTFESLGGLGLAGELLALELADLTGDGFDDLIASEVGKQVLFVAANAGDGTFPGGIVVPALGGAANVEVGDLDGDGDPDLVASASEVVEFGSILLGEPGLAFGPAAPFPLSFGASTPWVQLADMDGDGVLDAVAAEEDGFETDTMVWKGQGDGTFELAAFALNSFDSLQTVADYNGDGIPDVCVRHGTGPSGSVRGLGNDGTGLLLHNATTEVAAGAIDLHAADLDGDGNEDLVTASESSSRLTVLLSRPEEVSSYGSTILVEHPGTQQHFMAFKNEAVAGEDYLVLGSATGTAPGFVVDGVLIPLVVDAYTTLTVTAANVWITDSLGVLGPKGHANAKIVVSPGELSPSLAGTTLYHSFVALDLVALEVLDASPNLEVGLE